MPVIPTFDATISTDVAALPKATPQLGVATGISRVGAVAQEIGSTLSEIRDRGDIVDAQLQFEAGIALLDEQFKTDTNFVDIRERRAGQVLELAENVQQNISDRARRVLSEDLKKAVQADEIRFNSETFKREGQFKVAEFERNKNLYAHGYVFAKTPEDREAQRQKLQAKISTLLPYMNPDVAAKYERTLFNELNFARHSNEVPDLLRAGEDFNEDRYKGELNASQILQIKGKFLSAKNSLESEVNSIIRSEIKNHEAVMLNKGEDTGLALRVEQMGFPEKADEIRRQDEIRMALFSALNEAGSVNESGSLLDEAKITRELLAYDKDDPDAAFKQKALDTFNKFMVEKTKLLKKDPATVVAQYIERREGETNEQWSSRRKAKEIELAGFSAFEWKVLTNAEANIFTDRINQAIQVNDGESFAAIMDEINTYGDYRHKVLQELELNGSMHVALTAIGNKRDVIFKLERTKKPTDIDSTYVEDDHQDEIDELPFIQFLDQKSLRTLNENDLKLRDDMRLLAHKWNATGRDIEELFNHYNPSNTDRVNAMLSSTTNPDTFDERANVALRNADFSNMVSPNNANKDRAIERLKDAAYLVSADQTDERLESGARGFYVYNPFTNAIVFDQTTKEPMLFTEDEILATKPRIHRVTTFTDILDYQ